MDKLKQKIKNFGFYKLENIFSEEEINNCDSEITSMMMKNGFLLDFLKFEMSNDTETVKNQQIELVRPSMLSRKLRNSEVFKRCHSIAKEYFGGSAHYLFDHAIYKMPKSPTITHWHQDQAYLGSDIDIPSLHFWIPFQNTHTNNGTMEFVKGSHHELLPHTLAYPDNPHLLKVINEPVNNIYSMNINRGDVSLHTNLTLHSATSNQSDYTRKAWIIHFGEKPEWHKQWIKVKTSTLKRLKLS